MQPARYMLTIAAVRPEYKDRLTGAVHLDGTARVQIVSREDNELFWRLLRQVKTYTGLGCVINTSFNVKDQPIIMTPDLAVDAFQTMSLDRLYIEGYRVSELGPTSTAQ
jgi:carbamoyltransferase